MARPQKVIDPAKVEELAAIGATIPEIAAFCDCSERTIERRFGALLTKGRNSAKTRLRMLQWASAKSGSVRMQIFLGKQILGQKDKIEHSGDETAPVQMKLSYADLRNKPVDELLQLRWAELGDDG